MSIFTGLRRTLVNLFDWANDDFVIEEYALRGGLGLPPRLMFSWFYDLVALEFLVAIATPFLLPFVTVDWLEFLVSECPLGCLNVELLNVLASAATILAF